MCDISKKCFNDGRREYVVVICYSISVGIVLIVSRICWEKQIYYSQVSLWTLKVGDMTANVQEAAADRHLVLYDNFYLDKYKMLHWLKVIKRS